MTTLRALGRLVSSALLANLLGASLAWAQSGDFADIAVSKSGPAEATAGSDVTYTVTVFNNGPDNVSARPPDSNTGSITLKDLIPNGMTLVSAPPGCSPPVLPVDPIVCTIATLTAGTSVDLTFVFHIPSGTVPGTVFTNVATATLPDRVLPPLPTDPTHPNLINPDPDPENNGGFVITSTPGPSQADVGVTKTGPGSAGPGTDVVYTIVVSNNGPGAASTVTLNDTLPVGVPPSPMTFVSLAPSSGPGLTCITPSPGTTGTVMCTLGSLGTGAAVTFTLTGHIPPGTGPGTEFTNIATVSAATSDPSSENNSAATTLTVSSVDISVAKQGPLVVNAGDTITYALEIVNGGPNTAVNVQLTDPLPPNTTFESFTQVTGPLASCTTPPVNGTGIVNCVFTTLASGMPADFTLVIRAGDTTSITNTANGTTDSFDTDHANDTASAATTVNPRADVSVTKNGPATATAGANITYTITVTNGGPSTAATVSLTDTLPPNTTFVSLNQTSGPTFTCNNPGAGFGGTITCTIASLAPSASATFQIVFRLAPSVPSGGSVTNVAHVSTTTTDPDPGNDTAMTTATTAVSADVSVVKSGPDSVTAGSTVTYTVVVTNGGPSDASTVSLTDTLPPNTTFASENQTTGPAFTCMTPSGGGTGTITCTIATLASGASATFNIVLNVSASATGALSNTANVGTTTADPNGANNTSTKITTIAVNADVRVTKSGPASVPAGSTASYTVTVANSGPSTATTVSLTDTLPPNTTFMSLNQTVGPSFTCLMPSPGGTGTITCTIATLASGASATFSIVLNVSLTATSPLTNTANVSATSADANTGNNTSATTATVITADVSVAKSGPASVTAGSNVTYTVTVTNAGPSAATSVSFTDTLPPNATFFSEDQTTGPAFSCTTPAGGGTGTITCTIATFANGASATFTIVLSLSPSATGSLANTANVSATTPDPNSGNNTSTATATIAVSADMGVTKTGSASVLAGSTATYTVTVTNGGPSEAANVALTDTLPSGTTFVSEKQTGGPTFTCAIPAAGATGTITCTIATLASGASATFSIVLNVSPLATGQINNTASVTATSPDPGPGNSSSTASTVVNPGPTDVGITKTAIVGSSPGVKTITYTIVVTNHGSNLAAGVVVTDVLPSGSTLTSATTTQGSCTGTSTLTCTIGTLAPGASATITLVVTLSFGATTISNTSTVRIDNTDTNPANNSSTADISFGATAIPTLSPLAFALLGLTLALVGLAVLRGRRPFRTP